MSTEHLTRHAAAATDAARQRQQRANTATSAVVRDRERGNVAFLDAVARAFNDAAKYSR